MANLTGSTRDEVISGGPGDDTIDGGAGNDTIYGDGNGGNNDLITNGTFEGGNLASGFSPGAPEGWVLVPGASQGIGERLGPFNDGAAVFINTGNLNNIYNGIQQDVGVAYDANESYDLQVDVGSQVPNASSVTADILVNGVVIGTQTYDVPDAQEDVMITDAITLNIPAGASTETGNIVVRISILSDVGAGDYRQVFVDNVSLITTAPIPPGNDSIDGGAGDDTVFGGLGDDTLSGGDGNDLIDGGGGTESIDGGAGNDTIFGSEGNDNIAGGADDDRIEGRDGSDTIDGGDGDDTIVGYDAVNIAAGGIDVFSDDGSADSLSGGAGDDLIDGGDGNDTIDGGADNDTIEGGAGDDTITGGDGNDDIHGDNSNGEFAPFVSEAVYLGPNGQVDGEFVEITIDATAATLADLDDLTIYAYENLGGGTNLFAADDNISTFFSSQGQVSLQDILTATGGVLPDAGNPTVSVSGPAGSVDLSVTFVAATEDAPAHYVFVLPMGGDANNTGTNGQFPAFAFGNDATQGLISVYDHGADNSYTFADGIAQGATAVVTGGDSSIDIDGVITNQSTDNPGTSDLGSFDDSISGGAGDDTIDGGFGDDTIDGGTDNDTIDGAGGEDSILGGAGDDTIDGGEGDDTIDSGDENDIIRASTGTDNIQGGTGDDTYTIPDASTIGALTETITVTVNATGAGSVAKTVDGTTDTIGSVENFIADEAVAENDSVIFTGIVTDEGTISGFGTASGTFIDSNGVVTNFGPGGGTLPTFQSVLGRDLQGTFNLTGADSFASIDGIDFTDFENFQFNVICFCSGTQIATLDGFKSIETLSEGDKVFTLDNGYQSIRWIGSKTVDGIDLSVSPKLKPIRIAAGALGGGMPEHDLMVSQQHRMLVRSVVAKRLFDEDEVLIPAIKLLPLEGVEIADIAQEITYWHMLFDRHEVVIANGAFSESLFTGPEALKAVSPESRQEIMTLFPQLRDMDYTPNSARLIPKKGKDMNELVSRIEKNAKALFEGRRS